ncbi:HAD hydrolase family protein [Streptococcus dentiloxodontae]
MKFVFDLDGTLCFDRMTIDKEIEKVLISAQNYGHDVIFASARSYRDCIDVLGPVLSQNLVIGLNGGLIYEESKLVFHSHLETQAYQSALDWCHYYRLPYFVDDDFNYAYFKGEKIPFIASVDPLKLAKHLAIAELENPIKMVIFMGDHEEVVEPFCQELQKIGSIDVDYHEHEKCLYLNPYATNKATTIVDRIGRNFVAFGNDKNDIAMFKAASYAVQVGQFASLGPYADERVSADSSAIVPKIEALFEVYRHD